MTRFSVRISWAILGVLAMGLAFGPSARAQTETVLHSFTGNPDGANPYYGALAMDASGNLYGTTKYGGTSSNCSGSGCGTVFELVNSSGVYTEKVLYSFGGGQTAPSQPRV